MPIRITGMNSGLDTESIISELVKAKSTKKESLVKAQTKLQWKQDAWKELNTKVYSFYSKTLSNMRLESDFLKKTTKVSNDNAATVITGGNAVNGVQTLKIDNLATSGYLTGAQLSKKSTGATKLSELGISDSEISIKTGDKTTDIKITGDTTINDLVSQLKSAGVNASFDEKNQRFFISAKNTGVENDFVLSANNAGGQNALMQLGLATSLTTSEKEYYESLCTKAADGTYSAKAVSEDTVNAIAQSRVEAYQAEYDAAKEALKKNAHARKALEDKYSGTLPNKADLETKIKELEDKGDTITDGEKTQLADLKASLAEVTSYENLQTEQTELEGKIAEIETYCEADADGKLTARDALKDEIRAAEEAKATVAADILNNPSAYISAGANRIEGENAQIVLNGVTFTSDKNTFEINGLTITANMETDKEFTLTTSEDTDGIYDMIKNFFKEYNTLINEMDKLYNADSVKGYEPLTDEEKEAMSEKEIEKWEDKIKASLLRRDSTLSNVSSAMKQIMLQGVTMSDGTQMYLSEFGIGTLGFFNAADNEKNAYHIDGDPDDTSTSGNADKLKTAIANDPDKVVEFFSTLSKNLYEKLGDLMKKTEYSSSFTLYDDIAMKEDYDDYKEKIARQEELIKNYEDRYYSKFSAMETALAKLSSKESAISGLLGM